MPNHIKNRLELNGSPEEIKSFIERFSTHYPSIPTTSYDGNLTYKKTGESFVYGWLNEASGLFAQRNQADVMGVPEGWEQSFDEAWTRFPDFEKIIPTPASIKSVGNSVKERIINAVKAKYMADVSNNALLASMQLINRQKAKIEIADQPQFELACKAYEETGFAYWYDWNIAKWGTKWNSYSCEKIADNIYLFETAWSGVINIIKELSKYFGGSILYKYADEDTGYNVGSFKIVGGSIITESLPAGGSVQAYDIAFELRPDRKEDYELIDGKYEYIESDQD